ncbi:putative transporter [Vibrio aerogenes CECT 7868]|uniref:Putative transporter n=1 Tax=Vibrio aerogenes CECT 7868 TaxID=1216006 RepID=A0A1M6A4Z3_9VIBR|nr:arabinose transporter [Vibrio aerogenes]SHI31561.1 putative transporter [Vibrio aerogenes CECT 7868]
MATIALSKTEKGLSKTENRRLMLLTLILFGAYLCVAISLPIVSVFVTGPLGLNNTMAGLAVGITFFSSIITRGYAGRLSDRLGPKQALGRGLAYYALGALVSLIAGLCVSNVYLSYSILLCGRLLLGVGGSLGGVGIIAWSVGIAGPSRSGKILALLGVAIYGALAFGAPAGLWVCNTAGYTGAMMISALLPCLGLLAMLPLTGVAPHPGAKQPSLRVILGEIWPYGLVVCLQGIGFATIGAFFVPYFIDQNWAMAGLGFTAFGGGFVFIRVVCGHLPDKFGGLVLSGYSLLIESAGQYLIGYATSPLEAIAGAFLTGVGCSLIFPAMGREVVQRVLPQFRGIALGGFSAFQDIAYGLTGPVAGYFADGYGYSLVFLAGGVAASAGCVISFCLKRNNPAPDSMTH